MDVLVSNDASKGSPSRAITKAFDTITLTGKGSKKGENGVSSKRMRRKTPSGNPWRWVCGEKIKGVFNCASPKASFSRDQ